MDMYESPKRLTAKEKRMLSKQQADNMADWFSMTPKEIIEKVETIKSNAKQEAAETLLLGQFPQGGISLEWDDGVKYIINSDGDIVFDGFDENNGTLPDNIFIFADKMAEKFTLHNGRYADRDFHSVEHIFIYDKKQGKIELESLFYNEVFKIINNDFICNECNYLIQIYNEYINKIRIDDDTKAFNFEGIGRNVDEILANANPNYKIIDGVLFSNDGKKLLAYPAVKQDAIYEVPDEVISIEPGAFAGCRYLKSVIIKGNVTTIGCQAFWYSRVLSNITIAACLTNIGAYAFSNCRALRSINIPNSITNIEDGVFSDCSALTSINLPDSVIGIGDEVFSGCSALTSVVINGKITSIGESTFNGCKALTNITLPNSVTSIGDDAFSGCSALTNITFNGKVTSIGERAFYQCGALTSINIQEGVRSIEEETFYECRALNSISIPASVKSIGDRAFYNCSALMSAEIFNGVTAIGEKAFYDCTALTDLRIPASVTSMNDFSFVGVEHIYYQGSAPQSMETDYWGAKQIN